MQPKELASIPPGVPLYQDGYHSPSGITVAYVDSWTRQHIIEEDGFCPLIYQYLNKNTKGREHRLPRFRLPDTIVFDHNFPRAWYYYDLENEVIGKRPSRMLDAQTMFEYFRKPSKSCEVVAQFFYATVSVEEEWEPILSRSQKKSGSYHSQGLTYVEFFTAQSLESFLFRQHRKPDGVLQRFIVPKGTGPARRNNQLHVFWSSLLTLVHKRTNNHRLNDYAVPVTVRTATYDGPSWCSDESIASDETKNTLRKICEDIAAHFYLTEKKHLNRLSLYFKVDDDNKMWLLWCSSARVAADSLNPSSLRVPPVFHQRTEVINDGNNTLAKFQARRQRQKCLLALDYKLFEATRDMEFALNAGASHKRQGKALGMQGMTHTAMATGRHKDPWRNPSHPFHGAFMRLCKEEDIAKLLGTSSGDGSSRTSQMQPPHPHSSTDGDAAAVTEAGLAEERDGSAAGLQVEVCEELTALAMDAWYAVYSTTLSSKPSEMPTAQVALAEPLVATLNPDELELLIEILGLAPVPQKPRQPSETTTLLSVVPYLVASGRRLDRPSVQVESEIASFFRMVFARRGEAITRLCLERYGAYF